MLCQVANRFDYPEKDTGFSILSLNNMEKNQTIIQCSTVCLSKDSVFEKDRNKIVLSIPKEQILRLSLNYGFYSERPFIQALISIFFVISGFSFGVPIVRYVFFEENKSGASANAMKIFAYGIPLILLGLWFLADLLRRRYYLLVDTAEKSRKVVFKSEVSQSELHNFVKEAKSKFGYDIESEKEIKHIKVI